MSGRSVVELTLSYIEENPDGDLSLDEISRRLNYSKFYIARAFSEEMGCTLYKYIQGRRLAEAARKLAETEMPIVEIAYEAHYNSQQAFTLAFHQYYQCTPQVYRKTRVSPARQNREERMAA